MVPREASIHVNKVDYMYDDQQAAGRQPGWKRCDPTIYPLPLCSKIAEIANEKSTLPLTQLDDQHKDGSNSTGQFPASLHRRGRVDADVIAF